MIHDQIQKLGIHNDQSSRKKIIRHVYKLANLTHNQKGEKVNRNRSGNYRNIIFYFWIWNVPAKTLKQLL